MRIVINNSTDWWFKRVIMRMGLIHSKPYKNTRKYFTVYAGKNGAASGISFSGDNTVLIKTANGSISYDLVHDKAKNAN